MQNTQEGPFVQYDQDGDKIINTGTLTILEQEYKDQALSKHRANMVKEQKNFKGNAFISKPDKILFKDFTVGKRHVLIITLTNVSNAFNSFNVLPLPQKIRNYFEVQFTPKGKISPGITCDIKFTFQPQLNEDIFSQFSILAQTGKISYPIECLSKKTIVRCDNRVVDLGQIIYGESGSGKLIIRNQGSLSSQLVVEYLKNQNIADNQNNENLNQLKFEKKQKIQGNSQKSILFQFVPTQIGTLEADFELYINNFLHSPPIKFKVIATCTQVPVRIERQLYDFQICLPNHIYREKMVFYNQGDMPMSFKIVQPNQTKKYFQFNPIIGYIQKQSKIQIWVKFTAQKDLTIYLAKYLVQSNVYQIPFQMSVKQQILPVKFKIKFKVTSQRIIIKPSELNFGTMFQGLSSKIQVIFQNQSELPQQILLYPLKKHIYVQNDQPLFKILPKQTIKTFITYRSKKLQDNGKSYKEEGSISCKIITGDIATNEAKIQYSAQTIRPDLLIQNNKIDLQALQIDQICSTSTVFKNISNKQIIYELFCPYFQLTGLKITPVVKVLAPKKQIQVNIQYHSAHRKLTASLLNNLKKKYQKKQIQVEPKVQEAPVLDLKKENKKDAKKDTKLSKQQLEAMEAEQKKLEQQERLKKQKQAEELYQLQRNFNIEAQLTALGGKLLDFDSTQHYKWLLPIYFKQKDYPDASVQVNFIQVTTTSTSKTLIVDQQEIDFGEIAVGTRAVRQVTISNLGQDDELKKKQLPIFCCFNVINSLKVIQQNGKFKAVIQFQPIQQQKFQQRLVFYTKKYTVSCILKGKGVRPEISIQPQNGILNLGGVLLDQYIQKSFKIKNICNFPIHFNLLRIGEGILNTNSARAITYIPMNGTIIPTQNVEIKVKFKPDRVGQNFFQKIKVNVQEQKEQKYLFIKGLCYSRQAYVRNFVQNKMPEDRQVQKKVQYSFDWLRTKDQDKILGPSNKTVILQFSKIEQQKQNQSCFKQKIIIGSCKLTDPKNQKPTNYQIIMPKDDKFQCDNLKGVVAPGTQQIITFTFKPQPLDPFLSKIPILAGIGQWKDVKAQLKISGGFIKPGGVDAVSMEIILRAYISQL